MGKYKNYVREIARIKKVLIKDIAKDLGITRQALSYRINGEGCNVNSLGEIADYLGVELWELFRDPLEVEAEKRKPIYCPHCGKNIKRTK